LQLFIKFNNLPLIIFCKTLNSTIPPPPLIISGLLELN
jgi:hypothetical protein